jgi:superfamily II DNA or RNA helicase
MTNEEIARFFQTTRAFVQGNPDLRDPQVEGWFRTRQHFRTISDHAILQLPVGCGKTGLMALLPFGITQGRVLVIAPNLEIRRGISTAFDVAGRECFWASTRVLTDVSHGPFTAVLDGQDANIHDCENSHIVVTNIQQLASRADRWLPAFPDRFFDLILVDEGHHNVARSWERVFERFPNAKVVSLTATPFRGDGREIAGERVYAYPFRTAMVRGYIKQITAVNVAPQEISFTYHGDSRRHTLEEVLQLRDEEWFSRGVALAPECNRSIVDASIQWLQHLRETGTFHQLIAVACSVDHARQVRSLYSERGLQAREIHSNMLTEEIEDVLQDLRRGRIDCIVQVRMLGEGFDHPNLSVAAIFQPFRSLSPYVQFIGRVMRVIHQNNPQHPDNRCVAISHVGMNIDRHWEDFRRIDQEDQDLIQGWLEAGDERPPADEPGRRRRLTPDMVVQNEIISHFIEQEYLDPMDDAVIDDLIEEFRRRGLDPEALGLSRDNLRQRLIQVRTRENMEPREIPVTPQRRRQEARRRLNERSRALARRILNAIGASINGRNIAMAYPELRSANNYAAVIIIVNEAVNARLETDGGTRGEIPLEQLEDVLGQIDQIGDAVQAKIQERLIRR